MGGHSRRRAEHALSLAVLSILTLMFEQGQSTITAPPTISFISNSTTVVSTSFTVGSLALFCRGSGEGPLTYAWSRDGVVLQAASGTHGWTYRFSGNLSAADSGIYTCTVHSPHGQSSKQLRLNVLDSPRFLVNPHALLMLVPNTLTATTASFRLTPPSSTGNSPITSYEVTCRPDMEYRSYVNGTVQTFSGTNVTVTGLQPATKYSCWYRAENAIGISSPTPSLQFQTLELRPTRLENLTVVSNSPGYLLISFRPMSPSLQHGNVTGYDVAFNATQCSTAEQCPCPWYNCSLHGTATFDARWVGSSISLSSLRHFTSYQISVAASNRAGVGEKAVITFRPKELVPGPVRNITARRTSTSEVLTQWQAPEKPNGDIQYYQLGYSVISYQYTILRRDEINISAAESQYTIAGQPKNSMVLIILCAVNSAGTGPRVATHVTSKRTEQQQAYPPNSSQPTTDLFCSMPTDADWTSRVANSFSSETIDMMREGFEANSHVNFACREGLYVSGNVTLRNQMINCMDNGEWSDKIAACTSAHTGVNIAESSAKKSLSSPANAESVDGDQESLASSSKWTIAAYVLGSATALSLAVMFVGLVLWCKYLKRTYFL
ncbi:phosphatidylinositol phosphatase PTPRQ-like [Sycon ciliatum]|uniref:phosphatidylinositol phosphatase PTPRQ-like n=1 Tax=Sycon ciliatum TaxID=27933 RepID=UPI0031F67F23